jgi:hypothetical protein
MFGHVERRTFSASTKTVGICGGADSAAPTEVMPALPA